MADEVIENTNNQQNNQVVNKKKFPSFFVDQNQIKVEIFVVYNNLDGTILHVSNQKIDSKLIDGIEQISYKFIFTKPNYEQMNRYKQLSMYWDNIAKQTVINPFKLRNYIILNHLKKWENVTNSYGQKIQLQIDIDNTLTQQSLDLVYNVNSSIMDKVMEELESQLNV